jgi:hypothetical protein
MGFRRKLKLITEMRISAGGNSYNQAVREGNDLLSAGAYGVLNGLSEAALEKVTGGLTRYGSKGLSRLLSKAPFLKNVSGKIPAGLNSFLEALGKMADEGFEEYTQEIIDPMLRNLTLGEKNELKLYTPEAGYAFLLGAVNAGIMNAPGQISEAIETRGENKLAPTEKMIQREAERQNAALTARQQEYNRLMGIEQEVNAPETGGSEEAEGGIEDVRVNPVVPDGRRAVWEAPSMDSAATRGMTAGAWMTEGIRSEEAGVRNEGVNDSAPKVFNTKLFEDVKQLAELPRQKHLLLKKDFIQDCNIKGSHEHFALYALLFADISGAQERQSGFSHNIPIQRRIVLANAR